MQEASDKLRSAIKIGIVLRQMEEGALRQHLLMNSSKLLVWATLKQEVIERAGLRKSPDEPMGAIYLARLRLDGFASLHAGEEPGVVVTRPVKVTGPRLFVNADAAGGEVRTQIVVPGSRDALSGCSLSDNMPLKEDRICASVQWREDVDFSPLVGREVQLEFQLRNAHLYSFWFGD